MSTKHITKYHRVPDNADSRQFWTMQGMRLGGWSVLFVTAFSFLFAGCVGEKEVDESVKGNPLMITTALIEKEVAASVQTRSVTTLTSGSIGMYRLSSDDYAAQPNVPYTYSSSWSSTTPIYLYSETASICAYYPYSASIGNDPTTIPLTSQIYSETSDLSYATSIDASSARPSVSLTMQRAYAKMVFTITHDASYSGDCAVNGITIANPAICSSNTLDITSGLYGSTTASGSVTFNPEISSISPGTSTTATVLMVPSTTDLSGNLTFLFTIDGVTHTASLDVSSLGVASKFEAGKNYGVTIQISGEGATLELASTAGNGTITMLVVQPEEPANCFIVAPGASITIPVNIKGNGDETLASLVDGSVSFTAASVGLLWQSSANLFSTPISFNVKGQTATISAASGTSGNAVVVAYSGAEQTGTILWSWHIWVTDYDPNTPSNGTVYTLANSVTSNVFMDRNLGAVNTAYSNDNKILHYQWGRKDPFPAASVFNASGNTVSVNVSSYTSAQPLSVSVEHPFSFISNTNAPFDWNSSPNTALWGGATYGATKTIFDPCPAGWRVPSYWKTSTSASPLEYVAYSAGSFTYSSLGYGGGIYANGWPFTYNGFSIGFYPLTGYRMYSDGYLYSTSTLGYYWFATTSNDNSRYMYSINSTVMPSSSSQRGNGISVRCVQDF